MSDRYTDLSPEERLEYLELVDEIDDEGATSLLAAPPAATPRTSCLPAACPLPARCLQAVYILPAAHTHQQLPDQLAPQAVPQPPAPATSRGPCSVRPGSAAADDAAAMCIELHLDPANPTLDGMLDCLRDYYK